MVAVGTLAIDHCAANDCLRTHGRKITKKRVCTVVIYNLSISQSQAPGSAARDFGASIRQLIKRHVMLEEDIDASGKVIESICLQEQASTLAGAALAALVHVDGYRLWEVRVEVLRFFLCERISCNDCGFVSIVPVIPQACPVTMLFAYLQMPARHSQPPLRSSQSTEFLPSPGRMPAPSLS
jgi:hypothetical protein